MKHCLLCGKEIPKTNKFCSQSHAATYNNTHRKRKINTCKNCGKEICSIEKRKNTFCSQQCATDYFLKQTDERYLSGNISNMNTLKYHYIRHNFYECEICGLSTWVGKELVLILDHIDGNSDNNHPSNLRLVCPNCDSQLPTFKNRNQGKGRAYRRQRYAEGKSY